MAEKDVIVKLVDVEKEFDGMKVVKKLNLDIRDEFSLNSRLDSLGNNNHHLP